MCGWISVTRKRAVREEGELEGRRKRSEQVGNASMMERVRVLFIGASGYPAPQHYHTSCLHPATSCCCVTS